MATHPTHGNSIESADRQITAGHRRTPSALLHLLTGTLSPLLSSFFFNFIPSFLLLFFLHVALQNHFFDPPGPLSKEYHLTPLEFPLLHFNHQVQSRSLSSPEPFSFSFLYSSSFPPPQYFHFLFFFFSSFLMAPIIPCVRPLT